MLNKNNTASLFRLLNILSFLFLISGISFASNVFADNSSTATSSSNTVTTSQTTQQTAVTTSSDNTNSNVSANADNTADNGEDYLADDTNSNASTAPVQPSFQQKDPYIRLNRNIYQFNKVVDYNVIKPIAIFYKKFFPWPVTKGVSNFFTNLDTPTTIINDVFQANPKCAGIDTGRFLINSTIGVGGLINASNYFNIPYHTTDFGLTMARWGYKCSSYFVIPFLGPSTIRDTIGLAADYQIFSVYPYIPWLGVRYALVGTMLIDKRSQLLDFGQVIDEASVDPYVFERDAYLQRRAFLMSENNCQAADPYLQNDQPSEAGENVPH